MIMLTMNQAVQQFFFAMTFWLLKTAHGGKQQ